MERLTKRSHNGVAIYNTPSGGPAKWENNRHNVLQKLADYEDLEKQGLLLKLPCKVGDAVYKITGATVRSYDWKYLTYENAYMHGTVFNLYRIYDIGKTIFLTREEAEKKLEELRGGRK